MAELSNEQVLKASEAMFEAWYASTPFSLDWNTEANKPMWVAAIRAAVPFLQVSWEEPTAEEIVYANTKGSSYGLIPSDAAGVIIKRFVRLRNADLMPKPVDPHREKLREVIKRIACAGIQFHNDISESVEIACDEILAVVNEVK